MLEKVKKFVKDHEKEIKIAGYVAGGIIVGIFVVKYANKKGAKKFFEDHQCIAWPKNPDVAKANLDQVKELLELNTNNAASFAIFREGPNPNEFECVRLTQDLILPESFK